MVPANETKISENDWHIFCGENLLTNSMQRNDVNPMSGTNPWDKTRPQHRELRALLFAISVLTM